MPTVPAEPPPSAPELPFAARLLIVSLFLYLIVFVWLTVASTVLESSGFFEWFYGSRPEGTASTVMQTRQNLWVVALAFPFWTASVILFFHLTRFVSAAAIGLTLFDLVPKVLIGVAAALVLTPGVLGINYAAVWLSKDVLGVPEQAHPLALAAKQGMSVVEWLLLAFAVTAAAPLWEELLNRGALLRLAIVHPWGPPVAIGAALFIAFVLSAIGVSATDGLWPFLSANLPTLFVLTMVPVYLVVRWWSKTTNAPAVFAIALFFAANHSFAWPTPVALFVLALGLGYLTVRTGSLVPAIVVHSLFNGVSFVLLVAGFA